MEKVPLGRECTEDVANVAVFLASSCSQLYDRSRLLTSPVDREVH